MRRLKARVKQYRQMLDGLPQGLVIQESGRIRHANYTAARMLGATSAAQLVGKRYSDLLLTATPLGRAQVEQQTLRRLDGGVLEVEATARVLKRGLRRYTQITLRDITTDTPQHTASERLRAVVDATSAVITLDPIGDVVHWSPAAEQMTGYRATEMVGCPAARLISDSAADRARFEDILRQTVKAGRTQVEGWNRRKDGSSFYAVQSFTTLHDRGGGVAGFSLAIRDLTEQPAPASLRTTEQQLRQAQRMEAVGRLASGIAHDFNNLLTAIQGHAQFLSEDLSMGHPSRADVDEIKYSAERAAALTRQLLAFSRGQALQPETVQLNNIITAMERLLRRVISEDISVESALDPQLWTVRADPTQVEQVLVNLIVNARDAMPRGGHIAIRTSNVHLSPAYAEQHENLEPGEYALLAVSDTGVGMDHDTQRRIFEPFFTTKGPDKGTGLGLSTVFGIIKQMGGHIFVYSEPGYGSTFKVYLPRAGGAQGPRNAAPAPEQARAHEAVLIVEDDDSVRALARRVLEARGYRVWTSSNAEGALAVMEEYGDALSLIISDVVMPEMSGQQLAERIRDSWPHVGIVFMSGYTDEDVRRHGLVSETDHFIEKPFTPEDFAHKVREVLDELEVSLPQNRL
ncbi:MAG TPA: PAS domain S-box protein [Longimicrobiales bacterium]